MTDEHEVEPSARGAGLIKIGLGGAGAVVAIFAIRWLSTNGGGGHAAKLLAIPFVVVAMGLVEAVSGVPFNRLAARWEQLSGPKQVLLSIVVLALAFPAIFGTFMLMDWGKR